MSHPAKGFQHQSLLVCPGRVRLPFDLHDAVRVPGDAAGVIERLAAKGVLAGVSVSRLEPDRAELGDLIVVAATEVNTDEDRTAYASALKEVLG